MKHNSLIHYLTSPFLNTEISTFSAASCLYILVSIIPSTSVFLHLIYRFPWLSDLISVGLRSFVPTAFHPILFDSVDSFRVHSSHIPTFVSGILTVWSASKGLNAVFDGLTKLYKLSDYSYFRKRFIGILRYYLLLVLFIFAGIAQIILSAVFRWTFSPVLHLFLLLVPVVAVIYWIPCAHRIRFRSCFVCSVLCVCVWILLFFAFSIYLSGHTEKYSIYLIVMIGLWAYFSLIVFFTGGVLVRVTDNGTYHPIRTIIHTLRNNRK